MSEDNLTPVTEENKVIPPLLKSIYQISQKRAKEKFLAQGRLESIIEMIISFPRQLNRSHASFTFASAPIFPPS